MIGEELLLILNGISNWHFVHNVLLWATFYSIVAELQRIDTAIEQLKRIGAFVHEVDLGEYANCALALGVDLLG